MAIKIENRKISDNLSDEVDNKYTTLFFYVLEILFNTFLPFIFGFYLVFTRNIIFIVLFIVLIIIKLEVTTDDKNNPDIKFVIRIG